MNDFTYIKNGIELDIMDLTNIIEEKSLVSTKKQSRKKGSSRISGKIAIFFTFLWKLSPNSYK